MATEVKSPTFPESVADGTIANWVKKEGEKVQQDEVIAEIETDKVVLEVVAPFDGVISKIHKPAGEIVQSAELIEINQSSYSSGVLLYSLMYMFCVNVLIVLSELLSI